MKSKCEMRDEIRDIRNNAEAHIHIFVGAGFKPARFFWFFRCVFEPLIKADKKHDYTGKAKAVAGGR